MEVRLRLDYTCGNELLRFDPGYAYQEDGTAYPPECTLDGLPSDALVIDDVPDDVPSIRPDCGRPWDNAGEFEFTFDQDAQGNYPGKIDVHQLGSGFGGHFWFGHTRKAADVGGKLEASGTWTLGRGLTSWARVLVHMPSHGAHTQQAHYEIDTGSGNFTRDRYLSQGTEQNKWVSLGVYPIDGTPRVRLSTTTRDGFGEEDIAWDAVAFQPLPHKPEHIVAALGDSYSSGEGAGDYYRETDNNHGTTHWAACRRSRDAWSRKMVLPGTEQPLGTLTDQHSTDAELSFVACSGAKTSNVRGNTPWYWNDPARFDTTAEGQFREISQIDSGALTEYTTLVTLSIGGNDAGFADAIEECVTWSCSQSDEEFINERRGDIDSTQPQIKTTLSQIANKAPNAQIVLVGYPETLSTTVNCGSGSLTITLDDAKTLAGLADYMASAERDTVQSLADNGLPVSFVNPIPEFAGHSACDAPGWINTAKFSPNGEGDNHGGDPPALCFWSPTDTCLSRESFHPNDAGTSAYARLVERKLGDIGYQGG